MATEILPQGRTSPAEGDRRPGRPEGIPLQDLLTLGGLGLVHVMTAPCGLAARVVDVVVHDPVARGIITRGSLVAAVGIHPKDLDALALVEEAAHAGAVGLLVAGDEGLVTEDLVEHAGRLGLVLLRADGDVAWARLLVALHCSLAGEDHADRALPTAGIRDLFDLANAVAGLLGGAVAIEDTRGLLLAHSTSGDPIDEARQQTILQRRTPTTLSHDLIESGVYGRLWRGEVVRHQSSGQSSGAPRSIPRLAVAVRTPDEVLGVIWVLQDNGSDEAAEATMRRVGEAAVVHFLRHRAGLEPVQLARGERLRALLAGAGNVDALAHELDLDPQAGAMVVLVAVEIDDETRVRSTHDRAAGIAELHYQALRRQSSCVVLPDGLFVVVPDEPATATRTMRRATEDLVERLRSILRLPVRAAIGSRAAHLDRLPEARRTAVLAMRAAPPDLTVVDALDFANQVLLADVLEAVRTRLESLESQDSKLARLRAQDDQRKTDLVPTLQAYLDALGDVGLAASRLGVHPNTLRYRLQRMAQVADIDLDDPDERLLLALELRLL
jgi:hypothetical protein